MKDNDVFWEDYFNYTSGGKPRLLLIEALKAFQEVPTPNTLKAIDLGCGGGDDTLFLLSQGWHVLAIDGEAEGIKHLLKATPSKLKAFLKTEVAQFEEVCLTPVDFIYASLSVPFCHPDYFEAFWNKIVEAIKPGGRFAGHFFGLKDDWAKDKRITCHTEKQVRQLFAKFHIEFFEENEGAMAYSGGFKYSHSYSVIARKL